MAAIDLQRVSEVSAEPGELPKTMAAWVIREERFGEPKDAFQVEEIEVPEPGAFEVIVRVMAAGVNYNNVWAALGKPVSVMKLRRPSRVRPPHRRLGRVGDRVEGRRGRHPLEGRRRGRVHCNQASYEDPEVHGLDPMAAPSQKIWGYETTWGSFAQFTKVQAQQLLPKPHALTWEEAASYGLVYFTAYRMLITRCKLQAGAERADLGRRRRPRRVRHAAVRRRGRQLRRASSPRRRRASSSSAWAPWTTSTEASSRA